jgi:hypothetical protein
MNFTKNRANRWVLESIRITFTRELFGKKMLDIVKHRSSKSKSIMSWYWFLKLTKEIRYKRTDSTMLCPSFFETHYSYVILFMIMYKILIQVKWLQFPGHSLYWKNFLRRIRDYKDVINSNSTALNIVIVTTSSKSW